MGKMNSPVMQAVGAMALCTVIYAGFQPPVLADTQQSASVAKPTQSPALEKPNQQVKACEDLACFYKLDDEASQYIDKYKPNLARPLLLEMIQYAKDPKNYFDSGADWDEQRKKGVPVRRSVPIKIGGKTYKAYIDESYRPGGRLNRGDLVRLLYVQSCINLTLHETDTAVAILEDAKQNYAQFKTEHPDLACDDFKSYIEKYKLSTTPDTKPLCALLQMQKTDLVH
jgi:hypothetical protein